MKVYKYHGDFKDKSNIGNPIQELLTKNNPIFKDAEENAAVVVVASVQTWAARHGPAPLKAWRTQSQRMTEASIRAMYHTPNLKWKHDLSGLFAFCIIDEAQCIKNPASQSHLAALWLKADFNILVTGTPDANELVADMEGYLPFIEPCKDKHPNLYSQDKWDEWQVTKTTKVYEDLEDVADPAKVLRPSRHFFYKLINNDKVPTLLRGIRMAALLQSCMIKRTWVSRVNGKLLADHIPASKHRRAICSFTPDEQGIYDQVSANSKKKLFRLQQTGPKAGRIMWNWKHYRMLVLLSTWTGFFRIEDKLTAADVKRLMGGKDLLTTIVQWYCQANPGEPFPESPSGRLALVLKGAPKIRALLATIAEVVVKNQEKMVIFATLPAQQALVYAILQAMNIDTEVYHAGLSAAEKGKLQGKFDGTNSPMVLIGSYATMSCGLNLQHRCHWGAFIDPPPSQQIGAQSCARIHRLGGQEDQIVEFVTFLTKKTFNERQVQNNLRKAIPGVLASLNNSIFGVNISTNDETDDLELDIGEWVQWEGRLVKANDPRLEQNHGLPILSGMDVVHQISDTEMGTPLDIGGTDDDLDPDIQESAS